MQQEQTVSFFETLTTRHSKRKFSSTEIEETQIQKIISYVNECPTAGNLQSYYIFAVKNQEKKTQIASAAYGQSWIATAPCVLIFIALKSNSAQSYGKRGSELYALQDATIACSHAQLIIHALGMACCWVGAFDENTVGKIIGLKSITEMRPVAILPFGYSTQPDGLKERRKVNEVYTVLK